MTERCQKLIEKHKNSIENSYFLPIFLESLVEGGIEFFDEYASILKKQAQILKKEILQG